MEDSKYVTGFNGVLPQIHPSVFVDCSARIIGRVTIEAEASVWPGAVIRADEETVFVGQGSAVLDLCLIEAPRGNPVRIEPGALVSHKACVHGATIESGAIVGIGAIVLDGAVVGKGALVGAGAVVPPRAQIPPGMLALGQPAKAIRELKPAERESIADQIRALKEKAEQYRSQGA